ncbi:MAG: site-specific DNA-methyltransferase [bacterium]|nr:site-specific DNA-methyltransferase [bacterium]
MKKQNDMQQITKSKGRPMLGWVGKHPLEKVEWYPAQEKEVYGVKKSADFNKLFWGDNLQVLSHLLKDYRGKIDLIYIDPPFDSKADYVKKVKIRGEQVGGVQESILEEKQYTDIWENDEYLQFMYERLLLLRELLSDKGSTYIHLDWHKDSYLRLISDEIFGTDNFKNEIIWCYTGPSGSEKFFPRKHDTILFYTKSNNYEFNQPHIEHKSGLHNTGQVFGSVDEKDEEIKELEKSGKKLEDWWIDIWATERYRNEHGNYPTQKPEALVERIIKTSSKEGDIILDCFAGSGTTMAVAQKLGRKWIGCDINIGAIQTSTKRLAKIIEEQEKANEIATLPLVARNDSSNDFKGLMAFKIFNVNNYDIFKNEIEAKEIVMEMYGVEPIKRSQFDGILDNKFVKIMSLNKVLNKLDIKTALKNVEDTIDNFTPKTTSKGSEEIYEEGVIIICSGAELDAEDFLKKENKTGVKIIIRDILNDKKSLIFKKKPEAKIEVKAKDKKLTVIIKQFYSPILMRKLELENEKVIDKKDEAKVEDFKQIIDSVAIDVDYDGKLFNAEIIDLPDKKELIKAEYFYTYKKAGKNTVAIKIVDVLGEEYFETLPITV